MPSDSQWQQSYAATRYGRSSAGRKIGNPSVVRLAVTGRSVDVNIEEAVMQSMTAGDVPVAIKDENVEVRMTEVGEMTVSFIRLAAGTDLSPALVGLEGDMCPCPHWGYMLEGTLRMRTADGEHTYGAGQAFYWAPGHAPVAVTDCAYVDFSPTEQFAPVIRHIQGG